ncbi:hypothetical protein [Micromonospora saelicesensis]|nr:hypothetical protein [Micromonospora saelicesensis]
MYLYVDDNNAAAACGGVVDQKDWGREFEALDPDGNRLRVGALHQ